MVDEVIPTVTVDYSRWWANQPSPFPTLLTGEQQGYFLFGLMVVFVIGLAFYFYWKDKQEQSE
jgi:hypothetical protein